MRVAVVGLGLIGGSVALAARERLEATVTGYDSSQEAADAAWRAGRALNFDEAMTLALAAVGAGTPSG